MEKGKDNHYHNCNIFQSGSFNIEFKHVENVNFGNADDIAENAKRIAIEAYKTVQDEESKDAIAKLSPIFFGDTDEVKAFLLAITGVNDVQVVAAVNERIQTKTISDVSCHKSLWEILTKYGYYNRSLSNWNSQICSRRK